MQTYTFEFPLSNHSFGKKSRSLLTEAAASSFFQIELGLNWRILLQNWVRIAINKSDFEISSETDFHDI